jgi:hypothetical protein
MATVMNAGTDHPNRMATQGNGSRRVMRLPRNKVMVAIAGVLQVGK